MSVWKALYVISLVGISLAATAETKVDYRYEDQQPEAVADTLMSKDSEKSFPEPENPFTKKNLREGRFIVDKENNTVTPTYFDTDCKELQVCYTGLDLNQNIYMHNGAIVTKEMLNKAAHDNPDVNGDLIKLSDVVNNPKNRYVYIDFWATWCGPCRMSMESLADTYKKYKDNGFEVYTVSCDTNTEAWRKLLTEQDFGWIDVIGGMSMPEWKSYVVTGVPTSILIDCSTGLIIGRELYGDLLDAKLNEYMSPRKE